MTTPMAETAHIPTIIGTPINHGAAQIETIIGVNMAHIVAHLATINGTSNITRMVSKTITTNQ